MKIKDPRYKNQTSAVFLLKGKYMVLLVGISDPSPCLLAVSPSADRIQIER